LTIALATLVGLLIVGGGAFAAVNRWLTGSPAPSPAAITQRCTATTDAGVARLSPEQTANAALIAAVGQARGLSARAVTIALATAMQESKLRNLDYGDRDSLGLFQQRPSQDWGTPEQIMDPLYSAGEFYNELVKVPDFETMPITEAAQAVQRSAYPEAYAKHEDAARSFASTLTGHSPAGLVCRLRPAAESLSAGGFVSVFRAEWGDIPADRVTFSEASPGVAEPSVGDDAATPVTPATVTLRAETPTQAWAYAQWSVAKADQLGVESVTVAGQRWQRSTGAWESAPSPTGADAGTRDGVIVRLA
jgi:hypothetical protein